ncbi:IclR family transcriptional regulator [Rhodococcus sp. IEGM1428]|uniref:IclR family transcriptional regulator n=1 Tax=Rhodococcus sp. IEGM1428 TaxID=3392191 RepID=UPI003D0EF7DE
MNDPTDLQNRTPNDRSLTLDRGLKVVKYLAAQSDTVSVSEISGNLGLHRQAVYRLLGTLEEHGLAVKAASGGYRLGLAAVSLAGSWIPRLEGAVRPALRMLADTCAATAFFTVREGEEYVALQVVEPTTTDFHIAYRPGTRTPLHRGAGGTAILAGRPARDGESDTVRLARRDGVAVSYGQVTAGAVGVAAPIALWRPDSPEASVGVFNVEAGADVDLMKAEVGRAARSIADEL